MKPASVRNKGKRTEREVVKLLEPYGRCRRQPGSGAYMDLPHDVQFQCPAVGPTNIEVKARKGGGGFVQLERWMGEADWLWLKRDRTEPFVVVRWGVLEAMLRALRESE